MITLPVHPSTSLELSSFLIDQIEHGEIVTLTKNGQPIAQILPFKPLENQQGIQLGSIRIGTMKGLLNIPDDFDAPLPDDLLDAFEGKE